MATFINRIGCRLRAPREWARRMRGVGRMHRRATRLPPPRWTRWLVALALSLPVAAWAQTGTAPSAPVADEYQPHTGDARIDRQLRDINDYAARYPDSFVDEVSRYLDVPRDYVQAMLGQPGWRAGDIHFACALAKAVAQPCRAAVRAWSAGHDEGWQGVAEALGAVPGGKEYRQIRGAIDAGYAHWARPLPD